MKIIFLDIDGVLNSGRSFIAYKHKQDEYTKENPSDPYWMKFTKCTIDEVSVGLLNRILVDFDAKIVLSSTHRMHFPDSEYKLAQIQDYLSAFGVHGGRCIGYTDRLNSIRGVEIKLWIDSHPEIEVENMVILDDSSDFLPEQMEFHVHCKGGHGITEQNYFDMTRLFGREDSGLIY
jgi:hypothetical protein